MGGRGWGGGGHLGERMGQADVPPAAPGPGRAYGALKARAGGGCACVCVGDLRRERGIYNSIYIYIYILICPFHAPSLNSPSARAGGVGIRAFAWASSCLCVRVGGIKFGKFNTEQTELRIFHHARLRGRVSACACGSSVCVRACARARARVCLCVCLCLCLCVYVCALVYARNLLHTTECTWAQTSKAFCERLRERSCALECRFIVCAWGGGGEGALSV